MDNNKEIIKENQRIAVSKRMLQEALLRLLEKKSIQRIGVSELCREASVNRSTFYRFYSIPIEVMKEIIQKCINEINSQMIFSDDARQDNIVTIFNYVTDNRDIMIPILRNVDQRIVKMIERKLYKVFIKEYGLYESEEKSELICAFLASGSLAAVSKWLESDNTISAKDISDLTELIMMPPHRIRES